MMNFTSIFHHWFVIYVLNHVLQLVILLFLSPAFSWLLEFFPSYFTGKSTISLKSLYWRAYQQFKRVFRVGIRRAELMSLSFICVVFLLIPSFSIFPDDVGAFNPLPDDIMVLGSMLLFATGALKLYPPFSVFFGSIFILSLIEAILLLAAPGVDGFSGVAEAVYLLPDSGIIGASICYGFCFMLLAPLPRFKMLEEKWWLPSSLYHENKERTLIFMMFVQTAWLIFYADLFLPEFIRGYGFLSLFGFMIRIMVILGVLMMISLLNIERHLRIIFLLSGLGILLALAGRFAV